MMSNDNPKTVSNKNNPIYDKSEQKVEELAKMFASKMPKATNFNNKKSNKYFSSKMDTNEGALTIKDTLLYTSKNKDDDEKDYFNNKINSNVQNIINNLTFLLSPKHHLRQNSSNILKVSKEILKYAEKKSTQKTFYKIPAKLMLDEEIIIESDDEELNELIPNNYKQNKTVDNLNKKNKNEDSLLIAKVNEKLNNTDIDFINSNCNKLDIGYDLLIEVENIYSNILKNLETKKTGIDSYNALILTYFDLVSNERYNPLLNLESTFNDKNFKKCLKQFFIQELITFGLSYNREINGSKINENTSTEQFLSTIHNAFKTCFFYLHQNLIIIIFMATVIIPKHSSNLETKNSNNNPYQLCKKKVEENKVWLNKNNYKKYLRNNSKIIGGIIKNIIVQIKKHEQGKNINDTKLIAIIINYMRNLNKFKVELIRDNIVKNLNNREKEDNNFTNISNDVINEDSIEIETNDSNNNTNILQPVPPFLGEKINNGKKYTLVLDLDETLVHYVEDNDSAYIQIRPGAEAFLEEMYNHYEIVVFTAAMQDVIISSLNIF